MARYGAMNPLDYLLVCIAILAAWRGWSRGMLVQVFSWGGLLLGLVAGTVLGPQLAKLAPGQPEVVIALAALIGGPLLGGLCGRIIGKRLRSVARLTPLNPLDHLGGALISVAAVAILVWVIAFNLVTGPFEALAIEISDSQIVRTLDAGLPEPPTIFAQLRVVLDDVGFPQVFSGVPPEPGGPVDPPTADEAARAYAAGSDATVRITTEACGNEHQGSGFFAAPDLIVTDAHVIAGAHGKIRVQAAAGGSVVGTPVLFDPDMDLAVIRVQGLTGLTLTFVEAATQRGAVGTLMGYPDGGQLTGTKAAVRRTLDASGRDIYGQQMVVRPVLELQAEVRPGNSGGPFVTEDGSVAGVVFAASTTDPGIGYAIDAATAASAIAAASDQTTAVGTGACVR